MKIIVLTTTSPHHSYIIRELVKAYPVHAAFLETKPKKPPFDTNHPYLQQQEQFEREALLANQSSDVTGLVPIRQYESLNRPEVVEEIRCIAPDVILVVGTGVLSPSLIHLCPNGIINLHGGDIERYRGLDSFLWSIYHKDYEALMVTLHRVVPQIDAGEIIQQAKVSLKRNMELYQLRSENVRTCVRILRSALESFECYGEFLSRPQRQQGRYYSFMPTALKEICVTNFLNYCRLLDE